MTIEPAAVENYNGDAEAEKQASAMKDQLSEDVASWSAGRTDVSARQVAEISGQIAKPPALQPAKRVRRTKTEAPAPQAASTAKKPFSMSYDGVSEADYITYMIARGAR